MTDIPAPARRTRPVQIRIADRRRVRPITEPPEEYIVDDQPLPDIPDEAASIAAAGLSRRRVLRPSSADLARAALDALADAGYVVVRPEVREEHRMQSPSGTVDVLPRGDARTARRAGWRVLARRTVREWREVGRWRPVEASDGH